jgi:hypothetical protein
MAVFPVPGCLAETAPHSHDLPPAGSASIERMDRAGGITSQPSIECRDR